MGTVVVDSTVGHLSLLFDQSKIKFGQTKPRFALTKLENVQLEIA